MTETQVPPALLPNPATEVDAEDFWPHNVGHLLKEPTEIDCPACHKLNMTRVEREAVTFVQRIIAVVNFCLCCTPIRWSGRHDINHYCSKCGCYIGRNITLSWYKRQLFKLQRSDVEGHKWQRFTKVQKEELDVRKQQKMTHGRSEG